MADLYVSSLAGGGGAGTEGDPYTIYEAEISAGNVNTGDHVWIKADGTYDLTGAVYITGGVAANFVHVAGYSGITGDNVRPRFHFGTDTGMFRVGRYSSCNNIYTEGIGLLLDIEDWSYARNMYVYKTGDTAYNAAVQLGGYAVTLTESVVIVTGNNPLGYQIDCSEAGGTVERCLLVVPQNCRGMNPQNASNNIVVSVGGAGTDSIRHGISVGADAITTCFGNIVVGFGGNGIILNSTADVGTPLRVQDNIIWDCGQYGIYDASDQVNIISNNAIGNCTAGRLFFDGNNNFESDPIVLTADPFVDSTGLDFTLNTVTGGGYECIGVGTRIPTPDAHG